MNIKANLACISYPCERHESKEKIQRQILERVFRQAQGAGSSSAATVIDDGTADPLGLWTTMGHQYQGLRPWLDELLALWAAIQM